MTQCLNVTVKNENQKNVNVNVNQQFLTWLKQPELLRSPWR